MISPKRPHAVEEDSDTEEENDVPSTPKRSTTMRNRIMEKVGYTPLANQLDSSLSMDPSQDSQKSSQ